MIKLSDLLKEGTFGKIEAIAEASFRRDHNLSPKESLSEESFNFPEDHFRLNDNFGLGQRDLVFLFNTYEIGPVQWARPKYEYPSNLSVACSKWIYALGRRPRQLKCFGHKVLSILVSPRLFSRYAAVKSIIFRMGAQTARCPNCRAAVYRSTAV